MSKKIKLLIISSLVVICVVAIIVCADQLSGLWGKTANIISGNTNSGSFKYKITYLSKEEEKPVVGLLPKTLSLKYKDSCVVIDVEGYGRIFKSTFIKHSDNSTDMTLRILRDKHKLHTNPGEGFYGLTLPAETTLEIDETTDKILGFDCHHALLHIADSVFEIYYTKEISVGQIYENTVFDQLEGMPLKLYIEMAGIPMYLEAIEYNRIAVEDEAFVVPDDYEEISRERMDKYFSDLSK